MIKRIILVILGGILAVSSLFFDTRIASAADYDHRFTEIFGLRSVSTHARSPIRTDNTGANDEWVYVTSKNNQPRTKGDTNPHQGTDLRAPAGEKVFPILPGKVVWVNTTVTSQLGTVILKHDVDGDDTYDNYYVRYTHIVPKSGIKVGDTFTATQEIGVVDIKRPGGYDPHLHVQAVTSVLE